MPVDENWQLEDFSFATWGDTANSHALLVDMFGRQTLGLVFRPEAESGAVVIDTEFGRRAGEIFPPDSAAINDEGSPLEELLYGIKQSNGGFVGLSLDASNGVPSSLQWYDAGLRRRVSTELLSQVGAAGELIQDYRVLSMRDWQPVGDRIFALGALGKEGETGDFELGFYTAQIQTPDNVNAMPMGTMVSRLRWHLHYAFHHEFIALDGDIVYYLEMGRYPVLRYFDSNSGEHGRLDGFPGSDEWLPYPALDTSDGMYAALEEAKTPVGLYYSRGFLYAVFRQPEGDDGSSWKIVKLRPDFDIGYDGIVTPVGSEIRLPTLDVTKHLYFLPPPRDDDSPWLILELDSMPPGLRKHRMLAAVTIPQDWITAPDTSPLSGEQGATAEARTSCLSAAQ